MDFPGCCCPRDLDLDLLLGRCLPLLSIGGNILGDEGADLDRAAESDLPLLVNSSLASSISSPFLDSSWLLGAILTVDSDLPLEQWSAVDVEWKGILRERRYGGGGGRGGGGAPGTLGLPLPGL